MYGNSSTPLGIHQREVLPGLTICPGWGGVLNTLFVKEKINSSQKGYQRDRSPAAKGRQGHRRVRAAHISLQKKIVERDRI